MTTSQVLMIVFGFALAAGIGGVAMGIYTLRRSAATASWPKTKGKIISSKVEEEWDMTSSDSAGGGVHSYTFWPRVSYEYCVGLKHTGKRISIIETGKGNRAAAEEIVKKYPVGQDVDVSYNPDKPKDAVLEAGYSRGGYVFVGIGIFFLIIGAVGYIFITILS